MSIFATNLITALGGSTAVSRMTAAPVSTVHSWKQNGIPASRLAHLRLVAEKEGIRIDWTSGVALAEDADEPSPEPVDIPQWPISAATNTAENIRSAELAERAVGEADRGHPFSQTSSNSSNGRSSDAAPSSGPSIPVCSAGAAPMPASEGTDASRREVAR